VGTLEEILDSTDLKHGRTLRIGAGYLSGAITLLPWIATRSPHTARLRRKYEDLAPHVSRIAESPVLTARPNRDPNEVKASFIALNAYLPGRSRRITFPRTAPFERTPGP
jgi:hypothetical protein